MVGDRGQLDFDPNSDLELQVEALGLDPLVAGGGAYLAAGVARNARRFNGTRTRGT
jgi:hypothetical protein